MALNRFYYPTKYKSRSEAVSNGVTCVFLSHQKKDKEDAQKVANYLLHAGIDVYFDEYDNDLKHHHQSGDAKAVTRSICNGINNSSHMLVIVSPYTLQSTWVPFEIGYGYDKTELSVLCLKGIPKGGIPEYIKTVPIIRDIYDLNRNISSLSGRSEEVLFESKMMSGFDDKSNPLNTVMDRIITE